MKNTAQRGCGGLPVGTPAGGHPTLAARAPYRVGTEGWGRVAIAPGPAAGAERPAMEMEDAMHSCHENGTCQCPALTDEDGNCIVCGTSVQHCSCGCCSVP